MKKVFQKIFSLFKKADPPHKKNRRKTLGQSLVEFAITLPILLTLMTAVVEYGFMLNYYLSLVDASRDTARKFSGGEPFTRDPAGNRTGDNPTFYLDAAQWAERILDPQILEPAYLGRRIVLDPLLDDVVVTVYSIQDNIATQYPDTGPYHLHPAAGFASAFNATSIKDKRLVPAGGEYPPNEGLLLVEVHYNYHQVLKIVFFTMFGDPVPLNVYTIMPIRAAEPSS